LAVVNAHLFIPVEAERQDECLLYRWAGPTRGTRQQVDSLVLIKPEN